MSVVRIPSVLRAAAGGNKQLELSGASVGDVVEGLVAEYPSLRGQLLTDGGELNRFVNIYVNGQDVRYLDGLATPVGERDEVRVFVLFAFAIPDEGDEHTVRLAAADPDRVSGRPDVVAADSEVVWRFAGGQATRVAGRLTPRRPSVTHLADGSSPA